MRLGLMFYAVVLVGIILFATTRLPDHPKDKDKQATEMLDWYCHDESRRAFDPACLAEDLHRFHHSEVFRRLPKHERIESEQKLRELSARDDYAPAMEEARRGWCVEMRMLERGVPLCRVWRQAMLSKVEL